MGTTIEIRRIARGPSLIVEDAERLVLDFLRHDPSALPGGYDDRAGRGERDRISVDEIRAINQTMRARSAHAVWEDLTLAPDLLPWLASLDPTWDLVALDDATWQRRARPAVEAALMAAIGKGRGLSVATKVLHLKRPAMFPVLDSLVLQGMGVTDALPPIQVVDHLRAQGRRNIEELRAIQTALPRHRTLVRILDIILWASHPAAGLGPRLTGWQHVMRPVAEAATPAPVPKPVERPLEDAAVVHRFDAAMLEVYEAAMREVRYPARRFLAMVRRRGGLDAAQRLLRKPGVSEGFRRLTEAQKLELTMEYQVLQPEFAGLFTDEERTVARQRLVDNGILPERLP